MSKMRWLAVPVLAAALGSPGSGQLVNLGPGSFTALAPVITFDNLGTQNPTYNFFGVAGLGNVTVSFAGAFNGQTVTGTSVRSLSGTPTGPLSLNTSVITRVVSDGANPTSPVLSGDPTFNGPVSILFSQPVAAVGLSGGYFDAIGGTSIRAFDAAGNVLGTIVNSVLGIEFYGLQTASGSNQIAGVSFFITGSEPAGFAIDNVTFGSIQQLENPPGEGVAPEPVSLVLMLTGLAGVGAARRRRKGIQSA